MKIMPLQQNSIANKPSFKAGRVTFFSDFDGTYMPVNFNHGVVAKQEGRFDRAFFASHFQKFKDLFLGLKNACDFVITSGRNIYEMQYFVDRLPADLPIPYPKQFISSNGSDIYEQVGSGFNYECASLNAAKKATIYRATKWDYETIKEIVTRILRDNGVDVIESKVNSNAREYGDFSFEHNLKVLNKSAKTTASIRQDESLHFNLAFSPEFDKAKFQEISRQIYQELENEGIYFELSAKAVNRNAGNYRIIELFPRDLVDGEALSKVYDVRTALQAAVKNNDLVIVAGDSRNDASMLNLKSYLSVLQEDSSKSLDRLPIISILVDNGKKKMETLRSVLANLNTDSARKFIYVSDTEPADCKTLAEAIELAIKEHAKQDIVFAQGIASSVQSSFARKLGLNKYKNPAVNNLRFILTLSIIGLSTATAVFYSAKKHIHKQHQDNTQLSK